MSKSSIKPLFDKIEKPIAIYLKGQGFVKKGRTFNRETEKGIIQVVNLQSGSYPIGDYVIPGIRESYYGKFTVNLGIGIDEVWRAGYPKNPIGPVWHEYHCTIRTRLGILLYSNDHWWNLDKALIIFFQDRDKGIHLLQKYYDQRHWNNPSHKEYVYELTESIGVKLNKSKS